jgi:hypothetical protein
MNKRLGRQLNGDPIATAFSAHIGIYRRDLEHEAAGRFFTDQ